MVCEINVQTGWQNLHSLTLPPSQHKEGHNDYFLCLLEEITNKKKMMMMKSSADPGQGGASGWRR